MAVPYQECCLLDNTGKVTEEEPKKRGGRKESERLNYLKAIYTHTHTTTCMDTFSQITGGIKEREKKQSERSKEGGKEKVDGVLY